MKRSELAEVWRQRVSASDRSGLTIQKFCKAEGISTTTFFKWRRRLAGDERPEKVEFVELGASAKQPGIELLMKSGVVVRLGADFDEATLGRLLDMLDGC